MSTFSERLATAKAEPRPHKDVTVVIDRAAAKRRADLAEQLEDAEHEAEIDQRLSQTSTKVKKIQTEIDALLADSTLTETLRFYRLPGRAWSALTVTFEPRIGIEIDKQCGYNIDLVVEAAAQYVDNQKQPYGVRLEGNEEIPLVVQRRSEKNPTPLNEWSDLFALLSGYEIQAIRDAVWELNDYGPRQEIDALVKASGAALRS